MSKSSSAVPAPKLPSNRKFGWTFAAVFAAAGSYAAWKSLAPWPAVLFAVAGAFAAMTVAAPGWLGPMNRLWFQLGLLLGRIVSPVVLGLIFLVVITPVAVLMRLFGRDALLMKRRPVATYWVERDPKGPPPESFKNQF